MLDKVMNTILSFILGKAVANSERLRTLIVSGVVSLLALFQLPEGLAEPIAQAVAALGVWLATLYTIRKPGAPAIQPPALPPPPASADGVPGA